MEEAPKICVLTEWPLREGWESDLIRRTLMREGIHASETTWLSLLKERPYAGDLSKVSAEVLAAGRSDVLSSLRTRTPNVVLSLGEAPLGLLTGKSGIDKWQASVLQTEEACSQEIGRETKVIPCYPLSRVAQDLSLQLWVSLCAKKLKQESASAELKRSKRDFLLNPPLDVALSYLRDRVARGESVSVDIETGRGQVNTIGFALSPTEAIAINVLPDRVSAGSYYELWAVIRGILESDQPKILQNFIYETLFLSRYGIRLRGVTHDTMICQKFLWPEFEMGLDAVGRMYSEQPYWKEDGKSWNNIRDWERHYEYNCKDTTGTFEGYLGQRRDLEERGLTELHDQYLRRLFPCVTEMCSWGFPLSEARLRELRGTVEREYSDALAALRSCDGAGTLNPRSPAQVKAFLVSPPRKYKIPKRYDSKEKKQKESTDEKSLKKLRMKYPEDPALPLLLKIAKLGKAHSSYLSFGYDQDNRMRFSINCHGTETGRWSANTDPWDNGVNPQTVPGKNKGINIKSLFTASPGFTFLQCDLKQAETRFVAYDAADINLITALEDPTRDVHSEVAEEICRGLGKDPAEEKKDAKNWKYRWRQLGKRSGHGSNYAMKELTFMDSCLSEMDLVLTRTEAETILEAYHKLFPGIRQLQARIRQEVAQTRCLRTPLGRVRQFWGRLDDATFRESYSYRPQSTIPDIVNYMMLYLTERRKAKELDFRLLMQCHDSLLLEVPLDAVKAVAGACYDVDKWHPIIHLSGGKLVIPPEVETGDCWGAMHVIERESKEASA